MAVELGLNRYIAKPPENESEQARRERRNRERTYLVLFVHDRSLSMQTGRQWMLPEDDLVRNSVTWHQDYFVQSEDVIVAAFVQLRRIAVSLLSSLSFQVPLSEPFCRPKRRMFSICTRVSPAFYTPMSITKFSCVAVIVNSLNGWISGKASSKKVRTRVPVQTRCY